MFSRVLVPYDRSSHARLALTQAVDICRTQGAALTLLSCYSSLLAWPGAGLTPGLTQPVYDELVDAVRGEAQAALDEARELVPASVTVETRLVDGQVAEAILSEVTIGGHDLVVMGSRGRGDAGSLFLGSVSHRVLHARCVPVLVVTAPRVSAAALPAEREPVTASTPVAR